MSGTIDQAIIDRAVSYHGSLCPGLAVGIQAARLALREVGRAGEGGGYPGSRSTPTVDGDQVYALGPHGERAALRAVVREDVGRALHLAGQGAGSHRRQVGPQLVEISAW